MEPAVVLTVILAPWVVAALRRQPADPRRIKRGPPTRAIRDQFTPEEVEAHWDELRRRRSAEIKAMKHANAER